MKFKGGLSFGGDAETQRLSAALVEVESKLSVIMDERDEAKADFETWKEDMQAEMEKRDAAAEKKLEAAFAERARFARSSRSRAPSSNPRA